MTDPAAARYRAAIVGCGQIASDFADDPLMKGDIFSHAEAYATCAETALVAVADSTPVALARCALRWGVSATFETASGLCGGAHPDIVSVCTPTSTHFEVVHALLQSPERPRAILCEKPIATTVHDAEVLVHLAEQSGVLLVVMHMRRYARNIQNLKRFLGRGGIGELRGISGWLTKGTVHNGTHWFDLLRYLAGEVDWVSAENVLGEQGSDPTLDVTLGLASGMLATMRAAEVANFTVCEMDIMGTRGRAQIVDSSYRVDISRALPSPRYSGYVELMPQAMDLGHRRDVMLHAVEDIVSCLDTGAAPQSSGRDGVEALRIAIAAHESAATGERIPLTREKRLSGLSGSGAGGRNVPPSGRGAR